MFFVLKIFFKNFNFILNYFLSVLNNFLKIKKYYFNIFSNKKYFKK